MTWLALGVEIDAIELSNDAAKVGDRLRGIWVDGIELRSKNVEGMPNRVLSSFFKSIGSETGSYSASVEA